MNRNGQYGAAINNRRYQRYELETELTSDILGVERREILRGRSLNIKVTIEGIVVSRRPGFGISIRFTEMTEAVREQLRSFCIVPPGLSR